MDRKVGLFRRLRLGSSGTEACVKCWLHSDSGNSSRARASTIMPKRLLVTAIGAACLAFVVAAWGQAQRTENEAVPGYKIAEEQAPGALSNAAAQADRAVNEVAKANDQAPRRR